MTRKLWNPEETERLRANFPHTLNRDLASQFGVTYPQLISKAYLLGLKKSDAHLASPAARRITGQIGEAYRFKAGLVPWNKGKKIPGHGKPSTWFQRGRPAHEAHNYLPIGALRVTKDGYPERKVTNDPSIVPARRWMAVHRLVWTAAHGPIPPGHVVVFKPGRKTQDVEKITLDALELVTRTQLMRRNSVHSRLPPEVIYINLVRGRLTSAINHKQKEIENARSN